MSTDPIGGLPRLPPLVPADTSLPRSSSAAPASVLPGTAATAALAAPLGPVTPAVPLLPSTGIDGATQMLLDTLLPPLSEQSPQPLRWLSAQRWPTELARQALNPTPSGAAVLPDKLVQSLPALQAWLMQQGNLQTRQGTQGFAATLYVPASWLQRQAPAQAPAPPAMRIVTDLAHALPSFAIALALATTEGEPLSALLVLDFGAIRQTLPYGHDLFNPRPNPWLEQATLLAHGSGTRMPARKGQTENLCQDSACPYFQRAQCPQPFCARPARVPAVTPGA